MAASKGGRPRHKRNAEIAGKVLVLARVLTPHHQIATLVGLSTKTLLKYYRKELERGSIDSRLLARRKLFEQVQDGEPWAIQMVLKCKDGWIEKTEVDVTHKKPPSFGVTLGEAGPGAARADSDIEVSGVFDGSED